MRVVLLALLAVGVTRSTADACSCEPFELVLPETGSVDVPTNLPHLLIGGGLPASYELHDDQGGLVELGVPVGEVGFGGATWRVPILDTLAPSTHYELTSPAAAAPVMTFTTGAGADTTPPAAVTIEDLSIAYAEYGPNLASDCGNEFTLFHGTPIGYEASGRLMLRVTPYGGSGGTTYALPPSDSVLTILGATGCGVHLVLEPCADYTLSIWHRDLAGNEGPVTTYDAHVRGCPLLESFSTRACERYDGPDVCKPYDEEGDDDITPVPDDDGGCMAGGPSILAAFALLGLRRRRRCA